MIVIPMAGRSSRFFDAGYEKPKFMLDAYGKTLFDFALSSFRKYFDDELFVFIVKSDYETSLFVTERVEKLGIKNHKIIILDCETRGQAETVYLALNDLEDTSGSITIFNIDTYRPFFKYPGFLESCDGYLEVFEGEGEHWSFARPSHEPGSHGLVEETAEKERISDLCSTGIYYFSSTAIFMEAFQELASQPEDKWPKGELYIAPMYNYLIRRGGRVMYNRIDNDQVIFFGNPEEYNKFLDL